MAHNQNETFRDLLGHTLDTVTLLVRQELQLAQAEAEQKFAEAQKRMIAIVAGMLLGFCALLILLEAVVAGLATVMPAWLASVIVGAVLVAGAVLLINHGQRAMSAQDL